MFLCCAFELLQIFNSDQHGRERIPLFQEEDVTLEFPRNVVRFFFMQI